MAIVITWADFDKTIFVTPKNIRKLMRFTIGFSDEQEKLENKVADVEKTANDAQEKADEAQKTSDTNNSRILELNRDFAALERHTLQIEAGLKALVIEVDDLKKRVKALEDKS